MAHKGFTAIETLLTLGIIAVTAGMSIPLYRTYQVRNDLDIAVEQAKHALERAQVLARAGQNDSLWGYEAVEGVLFQGESFEVRESQADETYIVPGGITVSGLTEVVFQRVSGEPVAAGEMFFEAANGERRSVTIDEGGSLTASDILPPEEEQQASSAASLSEASSSSEEASSASSSDIGSPSENCANGIDDDGDMNTDCSDSDCAATPACPETSCSDNLDDNNNGDIDCLDLSCCGDSHCAPPADMGRCIETMGSCGNGADDDKDGYIDCADFSCQQGDQQCLFQGGEHCSDAVDNDGNDLTDCSDPACSILEICGANHSSSSSSSESSNSDSTSSSSNSEASCSDTFTILQDGTVQTTGSVDATINVLGSQVSDGAGGKSARVVVSMSTDDGETWVPLFDGKAVKGGEETVVPNLPSGTRLLLRVNGRHSWLFNRTFASHNAQGYMLVLRNGNNLPAASYDVFNNSANMAAFLRAIIENKKIKIHPHAVVFLTELDALWKGSSKFQDAVVQVQFSMKPGSCAQDADPKVKIVFDRLENTGNGDVARRIFVGENAIAFAEGQWIPLATAGISITDSSLVEAVPGMAVERRSGIVRVLLRGSHLGESNKEIADARVIFENAVVESVDNDSGQNATENPTDGIVNDGSSGDEVTVADGNASVSFQTRVTSADDAILIHWKLGQASSVSSSAASQSSEGSADSESSTDADLDVCAAATSIDNQGRIVLGEKADVTYTVLGSYATYGVNGPMVHVRINTSLDGGSSWRGLFNFRDILAGDTQTFRDVPAGSVLALSAEGRYSWLFKRVVRSGEQAGRLKLLRNGDLLPGIGLLNNPIQLKSFLSDRISEGKAKIARRDLMAIVELQDLDDSADYQDAVVLISIVKPASGGGVCGVATSSSVSTSSSSSADSSTSSESEADKITVCHFPTQDRMHPQTLSISVSAWDTHESHGDRRGACAGDDDGDTVSNAQDFCPNTYMPESTPLEFMLLDRFALTSTTGVFRRGPQKRISAFSLADTRGCSCEQLVDVAEGVREYYFTQEPLLLRELKSLFPFYTSGARQYGCGSAILRMARP